MTKWHSLLEFMQFPLKILFLATLMLGIGSAIVNPNVSFLWSVTNQNILKFCELLRYTGGFLISIFPILVYLKVLSRKFEDSVPVIVGVLCYFLINIAMVFFMKSVFPSYFYKEVLGMSMNFNAIASNITTASNPYNMGIITMLLAYFITMKAYQKSRHHSMYGVLAFVDHDSWAALSAILFSILTGIGLAYIWPYVINFIMAFFDIIAKDITNPINLFLYGIIERISAILGMIDIPRNVFWFTSAGGTWINEVGIKYFGDVAIWTMQKKSAALTTTAGSFITPYYIINMFIIPAFYIAYYRLCSSKKDRNRYFLFFVVAILLSIICGNSLPAEILMLILSPLLFGFYVLIVGLLFVFLQIFNVTIGYNFSENMLLANPGSSLDLIQYFRNPYVLPSVIKILVIGSIVGVLFYCLTQIYFKKYAFGLFQFKDKEKTCDEIISAFGGMDNILGATSTPDKLVVNLVEREKIDYTKLQEFGAYLILEAKEGYLIRLGNMSTIMRIEIMKRLANKQVVAEIVADVLEKKSEDNQENA